LNHSLLLRLSVPVVLALTAVPAYSETITVSSPVPFASNSGATAKQQSDCALDSRLPIFVVSAAAGDIEIVISTEPPDKIEGTVLSLKIVHVFEAGKAMLLRDPAAVAVRGTLNRAGEVIGSFVAFRRSWKPGDYDGISKECAWLGRATETIGRDIAIWLNNPSRDARLGDA
jgi:hypothetical protein